MPIEGRRPRDCFKNYESHIKRLISETLDGNYVARIVQSNENACEATLRLGFQNTARVELPSDRYGSVYFYMAQLLIAKPVGKGRHCLKTQSYWYRLYADAGDLSDPLLRWDYESVLKKHERHCKHHMQIGKCGPGGKAIELRLGNSSLNLNKAHLPTSYVLIEHVLRFLICDLGVKAVDHWEQTLADSERTFFSEFSPKPQ